MSKSRTARIYRPTSRNIAFLAKRLRDGELVAIPTETVYGLAANALDPVACAKIFRAKARPAQDPLIVHVRNFADLEQVAHANPSARRLARKFWPGPLTLILPKRLVVPAIVTAGRESVAVRMPAHPVARRFLKRARLPVAAPSANPFGYISPTTAAHVRDNLGRKIRYILDGGASTIGLESTIVDVRDERRPAMLRPGAITRQQLERALGQKVWGPKCRKASTEQARESQLAPGMMARHYSPRTPVVLHHNNMSFRTRDAEATIFMRKPTGSWGKNIFWFDARGDLHDVARHLFAKLREVDALKFRKIHVELAPGGGLADAINDRLRRAAAP
jgi:L-threonylcarbamoyladenylate synthase